MKSLSCVSGISGSGELQSRKPSIYIRGGGKEEVQDALAKEIAEKVQDIGNWRRDRDNGSFAGFSGYSGRNRLNSISNVQDGQSSNFSSNRQSLGMLFKQGNDRRRSTLRKMQIKKRLSNEGDAKPVETDEIKEEAETELEFGEGYSEQLKDVDEFASASLDLEYDKINIRDPEGERADVHKTALTLLKKYYTQNNLDASKAEHNLKSPKVFAIFIELLVRG